MASMQIFVSHSHEDNAFCQSIVQGLRDAGADVWYDEHNLGSGQLMEVVQRELDRRPVFIVILSKHAFASRWVKRETTWAFELADRDPTRIILPVTVEPIERTDFSGHNGWLFMIDFKRIEAPNYQPYSLDESVRRTLRTLALTPKGETPAPLVPQPQESAEDLNKHGSALRAQGKYVEALPFYERATQLAPQLAYIWNNRGNLLYELKRPEEALVILDHALILDPYMAASWNGKANALFVLNRLAEAMVACEQALKLAPAFPEAWNCKGAILEGLERWSDALNCYEQSLKFRSRFAKSWNGKANALYMLNRPVEALAAYEQAIAINPLSSTAWNNMAIVLRKIGRIPEAATAEARAKALGN